MLAQRRGRWADIKPTLLSVCSSQGLASLETSASADDICFHFALNYLVARSDSVLIVTAA